MNKTNKILLVVVISVFIVLSALMIEEQKKRIHNEINNIYASWTPPPNNISIAPEVNDEILGDRTNLKINK